MFAKTIVTSDAFLDMPLSARCLYFTLGMFADDDGFVNNLNFLIRGIGASQKDYETLCKNNFIIPFDDGVCVITHWKVHNYIQKDRYRPSIYIEHKAKLDTNKGNIYFLKKKS